MARMGPRGTGRHHALAGAATGPRARHRCGERCVGTTGLATLGFGIAAWQALRPTLERRIGEALRRAHALVPQRAGSAARRGGRWRQCSNAASIKRSGASMRSASWHARSPARRGRKGPTPTLIPRVGQAKRRIHAFGVTAPCARHRGVARADADAGPARRSGEAAHPCVRRHRARARHCGMAGTGEPVRDGGRGGHCRRDRRPVPDAAARHGSPEIAGTSAVPIPRETAGAPAIDAPVGPPASAPAPAQPPSFTRGGTTTPEAARARRSGGILGAHAQTPTASADVDGIPEAGAENRRTLPAEKPEPELQKEAATAFAAGTGNHRRTAAARRSTRDRQHARSDVQRRDRTSSCAECDTRPAQPQAWRASGP